MADKRTLDDIWGTTPPSNPMDQVAPSQATMNATPFGQAANKAGGFIGNLSQRPLRAVRAPKGQKLNTFLHDESEQQAAHNDQWWYNHFGLVDQPNASTVDRVGNAVARGALDVVQDPLSYLGVGIPGKAFKGRGVLGQMLHLSDQHGLPAMMRAANKLHPKLRKALMGVHDLGVDSAVKRDLAEEHGPGWLEQYAKLYSARNAVRTRAHEMSRDFIGELEKMFDKMPESEMDRVFRAIDSGTIEKLPPNLQFTANRYKTMTQALEHLEGTQSVHEDLARRGYQAKENGDLVAPRYAKPYISKTPRNIQDLHQVRENYVPTSRNASAVFAESEQHLKELLGGNGARPRNLLNEHDPHLQERTALGYENPQQALEATKHRIKAVGRSIAAHDAVEELGDLGRKHKHFFDPDLIAEELKNPNDHWADFARTATDFEKAGVFLTPTGHMSRIAALAAIDDPLALADATYNFAKSYVSALPKAIAQKRPLGEVEREMRMARMAPSLKAGAVQTESLDRQSPFITALKAPGKNLEQLSDNKASKLVGKLAQLPGKLYEASGHVLWHFDDEVKHAAFKHRVAAGMSPEEAALDVGADLVDYSNRSGLAKGASPIVPFATWRTKMPLAVIRGMIKHPGRVSEGVRLAPAAFGGDQNGYTSGLPYADVDNMLSDKTKAGEQHPTGTGLAKWARGSLAPWFRAAMGEALDLSIGQKQKDWMTGTVPPGEFLKEQSPILGNVIQWSGHGHFKDKPKDQILQSLTTIRKDNAGGAPSRPIAPPPASSKPTSSSPLDDIWNR